MVNTPIIRRLLNNLEGYLNDFLVCRKIQGAGGEDGLSDSDFEFLFQIFGTEGLRFFDPY